MKPGRTRARIPTVLWLAVVLALTFAAYLPSLGNGFTNWDDPQYVLQNPLLRHPTLHAVLTTPVGGNWHPLTIGSYILNFRIAGLDPASYHWLNLLLHLANTALVYAFVRELAPRRFWTVLATSLFFGIHPMHVESVAWISERKDVLYAFFYLAGLLAYLRYLRSMRWGWLGAAFASFVLSAASKPAAMVFPLALIAIDFYRGRRLDARGALEKVPFLAVSAAVLVVTLHTQTTVGAMEREDIGPVFPRILVACFGIMMYVAKLFVPAHLAAIYPYPKNPATSLGPEFYLALVLVGVGVPAIVYLCRRNRAVLFGIAFFFIHIFLVLQFVTIGRAVMADRYTYLPYVGLVFALAWGLDERPAPGSQGRAWKRILAGAFLLLIPISLAQTWTRCRVWRDSGALWTDVIRKFPGRAFDAYYNRGLYDHEVGREADALADFDQALVLDPKRAGTYLSKGVSLARLGRPDSAVACFDRALELEPDLAEARSDRGGIRLQQGDTLGAMADFNGAIRANPRFRGAYVNRGIAYEMRGDHERAAADYRRAIELDPDNPGTYQLWGAIGEALVALKRPQEAVSACNEAIRLAPPSDSLRGTLYLDRSRAWSALGDSEKAARDASEAARLGVSSTGLESP